MACDFYLAPSFLQLESALLRHLGERRPDPLAPRWVLVPTSTLAHHLRRRAAEAVHRSALAGVRIVPLDVVVAHFRERSIEAASRSEPLLDLLLQEAAGRIPASSALARLRDEPGAFDLLNPTFRDLADAGFGPAQLDLLETLAEEGDLSAGESDLLRLFAGWVRLLADAGIRWQPLADQQLPEWIEALDDAELGQLLGAEHGQQVELLLHGFYELTDVNTDILCALARRLAVTVFFPWHETAAGPHPAYRFAESYLETLRLRLGPAAGSTRSEDADRPTARFFVETFPEGEIESQPDWLTHQSACGRRGEVIAAAARIRGWLDDPELALAPEQVLVAVPEMAGYADVIREVFADFAIPTRLSDQSAALAPETRPVRRLVRLWREQAPTEMLLAYLREWPGIEAAADVDLEHFENELRRAGCWGGPAFEALIELTRQGAASLEEAETEFIGAAARLWVEPAASRPVAAWADWIEEVASAWLPEPAVLTPLSEGLRAAAALRPALELPVETVRRLLAAAAVGRPGSDPPQRGGVTVAPMMRARGLTGEGVVVLGLAAESFPIRLDEDPLLSDDSRRRLRSASGAAGHRLSLRSALSDEMALLFVLLNSSAERVHWVVPETDELGKSVSPTPWVERYRRRWRLEAAKRVPRSPHQQARVLLEADPDGRLLPPALGFLIDSRLAELVGDAAHYAHVGRTRRLLQLQPDWQGFIRAPGWKQPLPDPDDPPRVSVTRLESLARCPYRFYVNEVSGWKPLEPAAFRPELPPLEWGGLVHRFLEAALQPVVGEPVLLSQRAGQLLADNAAELRHLTTELPPRLSAAYRLLPPVLAHAARWRLFRLAFSYFASVGSQVSDGRILTQELKLRRAFPELEPLLVSGVVDRVDVDAGGQRTVIDYKSGRAPTASKRRRQTEIGLGFLLQPWLYPWLLEEPGESTPRFSYQFLGGEDPVEETVELPGDVTALLNPLGRIIKEGFFFPTSNETLSRLLGQPVEPCLYCDLPSLCRRFESRRTRQALRWLQTWVPDRFGAHLETDPAAAEAEEDEQP